MKVSLKEIKEIFDQLIEENKSRASIATWGLERHIAYDANDLEFEPIFEKEKILKCILYLMGVDLIDFDGSYLHSIDNFIDFKKENNI